MIVRLIKRLILKYGFGRPAEPKEYLSAFPKPSEAQMAEWARGARNVANDPEYRALMAAQSLNMAPGAVKARRLASIARERDALKAKLTKARREKKARRHLYAALEALTREEMQLAGDVR